MTSRGSLRSFFSALLFHSTLYEAIPLQFGNELFTADGRLVAALSHGSQGIDVFQQFFVFGHGQDHRDTVTLLIGDVLRMKLFGGVHGAKSMALRLMSRL